MSSPALRDTSVADGDREPESRAGVAAAESAAVVNAMSVDVEEHFQVSAFEGTFERQHWGDLESRVSTNVMRILERFDAADAKATFFTLGWVAERLPDLVRAIVDSGHEIASHGYDHARVRSQTPDQFRDDVSRCKKILEDVAGVAVTGYRAPSFSIGDDTPWAHDTLKEAGYEYSSSIYPISHDHYGMPDAPRSPFRSRPEATLEIPLTTVRFAGRNWPAAGGGYFRLLPLLYSRWAMRRVTQTENRPVVFYFHPWEIDPDQPRVDGLSAATRFRHYVNLSRFEDRLCKILDAYSWDRMDRVFHQEITSRNESCLPQ